MVLDEPTGSLDLAGGAMLMREARRMARERGIAVLASLHDLSQALRLADRCLQLHEGRILHDVPPGEITAEMLERLYGTPVRIVEAEGERFVLPESP